MIKKEGGTGSLRDAVPVMYSGTSDILNELLATMSQPLSRLAGTDTVNNPLHLSYRFVTDFQRRPAQQSWSSCSV